MVTIMSARPICPDCSSTEPIPIVYGNQEQPALDLARFGLIRMESSIVLGLAPLWHCTTCDKDLPVELGAFHSSCPVYQGILADLWDRYYRLSENEIIVPRGRHALDTILGSVFTAGATALRCDVGRTSASLFALADSDWVELEAAPYAMVQDILVFLYSIANSDTLPIEAFVGIAITKHLEPFAVLVSEECSHIQVMIRPVAPQAKGNQ